MFHKTSKVVIKQYEEMKKKRMMCLLLGFIVYCIIAWIVFEKSIEPNWFIRGLYGVYVLLHIILALFLFSPWGITGQLF